MSASSPNPLWRTSRRLANSPLQALLRRVSIASRIRERRRVEMSANDHMPCVQAASSKSDAPCPFGAYWVWLWLHDSTRPERSVTVISTIP